MHSQFQSKSHHSHDPFSLLFLFFFFPYDQVVFFSCPLNQSSLFIFSYVIHVIYFHPIYCRSNHPPPPSPHFFRGGGAWVHPFNFSQVSIHLIQIMKLFSHLLFLSLFLMIDMLILVCILLSSSHSIFSFYSLFQSLHF